MNIGLARRSSRMVCAAKYARRTRGGHHHLGGVRGVAWLAGYDYSGTVVFAPAIIRCAVSGLSAANLDSCVALSKDALMEQPGDNGALARTVVAGHLLHRPDVV
jgi:hypothetical protein